MAAKSRPRTRARRRPAVKRAKTSRKAARQSKGTGKSAKRRPVKRVARPRKAARKTAAKTKRRAPRPKPRTAKAPARPATPPPPVAAATKAKRGRPRTSERPALDRSRRLLADAERLELDSAAVRHAVEPTDRMLSSVRAGHDEMRAERALHTESSPVLTAGDVDARWQDAYAVGDEAPGGDNPTPGQDRVDDIGKALGIQYQDDQELQGGDEVTERDKHRWELDPASSDDWPHDKD